MRNRQCFGGCSSAPTSVLLGTALPNLRKTKNGRWRFALPATHVSPSVPAQDFRWSGGSSEVHHFQGTPGGLDRLPANLPNSC